ncbi:MAG: flagellar hook-basal body complex protein FliE [Alphaproteobacteria bacterium]|nr:flagellar hook-basal body complex protein FliE [Alphaproteobacteria bacterium]
MVNITSNPAAAANAYSSTAKIAPPSSGAGQSSFGDFLEDATRSAIGTLKAGEKASAGAITGTIDPLAVTQAVTAARLTLDTVSAVRDAAVDAYNKIQGMPI